MSTFDETNVRRQPEGVTTGGQFATKPKGETDVALTPGHHDTQLVAARDAAAQRVSALWAAPGGGDTDLRHREQLRAAAYTVKLHYPAAVSFEIGESDQAGSEAGYVGCVFDAEGNDLTEGYAAELGEDEDLAHDMLYDAQTMYVHDGLPGLTAEGSEAMGYVRKVDIKTITAEAPTSETDVDASVNRATGVIQGYQAHHGDLNATAQQTAKALLTDLVRWAAENDVDLQGALDGAVKDARAADGRPARPSDRESLDRIGAARPFLDAETTDAELAEWARLTIIPALEDADRL